LDSCVEDGVVASNDESDISGGCYMMLHGYVRALHF